MVSISRVQLRPDFFLLSVNFIVLFNVKPKKNGGLNLHCLGSDLGNDTNDQINIQAPFSQHHFKSRAFLFMLPIVL